MNKFILEEFANCVKIAKDSPNKEFKHGAIAIFKNKVVGSGTNSFRSSWVQRLYAKRVGRRNAVYEHAEFAAMREVPNYADTLIVVRVSSKDDKLTNSKPCSICQLMIKESGIKHLYYSNAEGGITYERIN